MVSRVAALFLLIALPLGAASAAAQTTADLRRMSLQDLLDVPVTTVSRVPEDAATVPAAVFVITQEDIRRSGATSLPEALRLAPGLQVARIGAGTWSIGSRGFADRLARSMLVMIDGRAVYSPLFAGTYWESQDVLLSDVDRIEVIRGPGGTLWGANAVNGIINIITKQAADTQGALLNVGAGSEDRAFGGVRYGGTSGSMSYRAYVKAFDRGPEFHADGNDYDHWHAGQGGFRADWHAPTGRTVTLQGDLYDGRLGERATLTSYTSPFSEAMNLDAPISGGNVVARVAGQSSARSDYQLQAYYDRTNRDELPVGEQRDTADADFQQTIRNLARNTVTWGAGYRVTSGRITAVAPSALEPATRTDNLFSVFLQDEIATPSNRWRFTLGSKFEHNDYSGFEVQPSGRMLFAPDSVHAFWAAVTRAVRTPSRVETDYTTTSLVSAAGLPTFVRLLPNPEFDSEKLVAYELGYRVRPAERVFVTASAFYNDLRDTLSTDLQKAFVETSPPPVRLILPVDFANGLHGNSHGVEVTADVRPAPRLRLTANYSYLGIAMTKNPGSTDVSQEHHYEGSSPHHQVEAGTSIDISRWSLDWFVRYVSALPSSSVPGYAESDLRIGWQPGSHLDLSLVGQDLLHDHHLEWPSGAGANIEVHRAVYARVTWRP